MEADSLSTRQKQLFCKYALSAKLNSLPHKLDYDNLNQMRRSAYSTRIDMNNNLQAQLLLDTNSHIQKTTNISTVKAILKSQYFSHRYKKKLKKQTFLQFDQILASCVYTKNCTNLFNKPQNAKYSKDILALLVSINYPGMIKYNHRFSKIFNTNSGFEQLKYPRNVLHYFFAHHQQNFSSIFIVTEDIKKYKKLSYFIQRAYFSRTNKNKNRENYENLSLNQEQVEQEQNDQCTYGLNPIQVQLIIQRIIVAIKDILQLERVVNQRLSLIQGDNFQYVPLIKYFCPETDILVDPETLQVKFRNFGYLKDIDILTSQYGDTLADSTFIYRHPNNHVFVEQVQLNQKDRIKKYSEKEVKNGLKFEDFKWQVGIVAFRLLTGLWPFKYQGQFVYFLKRSDFEWVREQMIQISKNGILKIEGVIEQQYVQAMNKVIFSENLQQLQLGFTPTLKLEVQLSIRFQLPHEDSSRQFNSISEQLPMRLISDKTSSSQKMEQQSQSLYDQNKSQHKRKMIRKRPKKTMQHRKNSLKSNLKMIEEKEQQQLWVQVKGISKTVWKHRRQSRRLKKQLEITLQPLRQIKMMLLQYSDLIMEQKKEQRLLNKYLLCRIFVYVNLVQTRRRSQQLIYNIMNKLYIINKQLKSSKLSEKDINQLFKIRAEMFSYKQQLLELTQNVNQQIIGYSKFILQSFTEEYNGGFIKDVIKLARYHFRLLSPSISISNQYQYATHVRMMEEQYKYQRIEETIKNTVKECGNKWEAIRGRRYKGKISQQNRSQKQYIKIKLQYKIGQMLNLYTIIYELTDGNQTQSCYKLVKKLFVLIKNQILFTNIGEIKQMLSRKAQVQGKGKSIK